ncbi:MAG: cation diffusion facilitator family transporter [Treponema sp.]|nr:cation diffusion facilitator family transporter [Treponema sp.]
MTDNNSILSPETRNKIIVRTGIFGIVANFFLAAFKIAVGLLSNSIAVILDAVNNTADAISSLITIIGAKFAAKRPDKKHPLGYGRIEYLSAMIVAALVLYTGITAVTESIKKILHPENAEYSLLSLIIIGTAVLVKVFMGIFIKKQGKKSNSNALIASGTDALFDAILSCSVFVAAIIYTYTGISLEAYLGVIIGCFIVKSALELMLETVNDIIGHRAEPSLVRKIKSMIAEEEGVQGAYDLIINNYGPDKNLASVHIEVPDVMTIEELDKLTRKIEAKVYCKTGIILTAVGVYSYNTKNDQAAKIKNEVLSIVKSFNWALQMHGFFIDFENKTMRFDVVTSFEIKSEEAIKLIKEKIKEKYPEYTIQATPDVDISDL